MLIKGKKAEYYVNQWMHSDKRVLTDCYKRPSIAKQRAYLDCCDKMLEMGGFDDTILSHNSMTFVMAWRYYDIELCADMLHVETAYNSYDMII